MHFLGLDDVVVVEDQHPLYLGLVQVIDDAGQDRFARRLGGRLEQLSGLGADLARGPERGDQVGEESLRVVVALVQRQPRRCGRRRAAPAEPLAQDRGLAEPGRRRDEHEPRQRPAAITERLGQPRTRDQRAARIGDPDLRPQHGHSTSIRALARLGELPLPGSTRQARPRSPRRARSLGQLGWYHSPSAAKAWVA